VWGNLTLNVVGGILAGLAFLLWPFAARKVTKGRFKQLFGSKAVEEGITLIYEEMALPPQLGTHPYFKPGYEATGRFFSIARAIPIASVRAISYLSNT
jgi:hypothetical protein